jgi:hypothetical protein
LYAGIGIRSAPGRYVDSPLDKSASTSASLHVRFLPSPSVKPASACVISGRRRIVLRRLCFFGGVRGDIVTSLFVVDEIIALDSVHIDEPATRFGLISIFSKVLLAYATFRGISVYEGLPCIADSARKEAHTVAPQVNNSTSVT